ncbi:MAG TPA: helix-turn-helix domain-containing protein [Polyangiaceae bacterium]|nr:helix-turn-helix domain-containing protein [Polyangiaceae bacterium]
MAGGVRGGAGILRGARLRFRGERPGDRLRPRGRLLPGHSRPGTLERAGLRPQAFAHAEPSSLEEHRRVFGDDLHFDAPRTELEMDPAVLARPVLSADPHLCALIERHAEALLQRLPSSGSLTDRARAALVEGLRWGRTEVAAVAESLRMSARTLQRRLSAEGTSYAELLDVLRRELALRYVADHTLSLSEVAFLVGFADQTTFHRAFARWTGRTPGAFRKR